MKARFFFVAARSTECGRSSSAISIRAGSRLVRRLKNGVSRPAGMPAVPGDLYRLPPSCNLRVSLDPEQMSYGSQEVRILE